MRVKEMECVKQENLSKRLNEQKKKKENNVNQNRDVAGSREWWCQSIFFLMMKLIKINTSL